MDVLRFFQENLVIEQDLSKNSNDCIVFLAKKGDFTCLLSYKDGDFVIDEIEYVKSNIGIDEALIALNYYDILELMEILIYEDELNDQENYRDIINLDQLCREYRQNLGIMMGFCKN